MELTSEMQNILKRTVKDNLLAQLYYLVVNDEQFQKIESIEDIEYVIEKLESVLDNLKNSKTAISTIQNILSP